MSSPESLRITEDMLPAIRANALVGAVRTASYGMLIWGVIWMCVVAEQEGMQGAGAEMLGAWTQAIVAGIMILVALFGLMSKSPKVILVEALWVGVLGAVNVALTAFVLIAPPEDWYLTFGCYGIVIGLFQMGWGWREHQRYKAVRVWSDDLANVAPDHRTQMRRWLKKFMKSDEDFFEGRIKGMVGYGQLFVRFLFSKRNDNKGYRGQVLDDKVVMFAKSMNDYVEIPAGAEGLENNSATGVMHIETSQGRKKIQFGPLSLLQVKLWAGSEITRSDIHLAATRRVLSAEILGNFVRGENPDTRLAVIEHLRYVKKNDPHRETLAAECLNDAAPAVRAAAMEVSSKLKLGGLHEHVLPHIQDDDRNVRLGAAAYLARFASPESLASLEATRQNEQDEKVQKAMDKAIKACRKLDANPYTTSQN